MKGTIINNDVLMDAILQSIKESRASIRFFRSLLDRHTELADLIYPILDHETAEMKAEIQNLVELKRNRARQAIIKEVRSNEYRLDR